MIKDILDFFIALLLAALSLPFLLLLIIFVKFNIRGSAIFKQKRIGKGGKEFILFKLRTLDVNTPAYAPKPNERDPAISKSGRFLRKSCLDELPQLYNVLKGDMSLVGPRPEMPFLIDSFKENQAQRLSVKPGITGLWQISGKTHEAIYRNVEFDLCYIENQSLFLDLKILFITSASFLRMLASSLKYLFIGTTG